MTYKIYLVEDKKDMNQLLSSYLKKEGWMVTSFLNGESARESIQDNLIYGYWILCYQV